MKLTDYKNLLLIVIITVFTVNLSLAGKLENEERKSKKNSNIVYIDISISQPNLEDCFSSFVTSEQYSEQWISIYPNPNEGVFNLEIYSQIPGKTFIITVFDVAGKEVYKTDKTANDTNYKTELDISNLKKGVYFIQVINNDNMEQKNIQKLIVN